MLRSTMLILALAAAPAVMTAQQPKQTPARATASRQTPADTTKAKAHKRRARKAKPATATAMPRDTMKAKP